MACGYYKIRGQPGLDSMDFDDLYNLKVYDHEMNGLINSKSHNIAFVTSENDSSTSSKSTAYHVQSAVSAKQNPCTTMITTFSSPSSNTNCDDVVCSFFSQQANLPVTYQEELMQIDEDALEEIDIRWQVAMITARIKKLINKTAGVLISKSSRV